MGACGSDQESLDSFAKANNHGMLYDPKGEASFRSHRWNFSTNPDLTFASVSQDNQQPDKHFSGKLPQLQH